MNLDTNPEYAVCLAEEQIDLTAFPNMWTFVS